MGGSLGGFFVFNPKNKYYFKPSCPLPNFILFYFILFLGGPIPSHLPKFFLYVDFFPLPAINFYKEVPGVTKEPYEVKISCIVIVTVIITVFMC
jgi:hypothetical protein